MAHKSSTPVLALVGLACLNIGAAHAAQLDAGTLLDSTRTQMRLPRQDQAVLPATQSSPSAAKADTTRIAVKGFRITGSSVFPGDVLQTLVADAIGKELTLGELDAVAARITRRYHEAGYLLARAYLPAQDIRDGVVEIAILEGRLGRVNLMNDSAISSSRLSARLQDIREGEPLDGAKLERDLLLLGDLPGVEVKSTLKPGASVGSSDLDIRVGRRAPIAGDVELDNYGNRYTGEYRLGADISAGNLAGLGDTLNLRTLASEDLGYWRLAWQAPLGASGTQAGVAWSEMGYRLGKDFSSLDAHGSASIGSLYLLHPFVRSRRVNLDGQLSYDHKQLDDLIDSTSTVSGKKIDVYTLGLSGNRFDALGGGGLTSASLALSHGRLTLDSASLPLDASGYRTAGGYDKLAYSVIRVQRLGGDFSLYAGLQGQAAGKNLDSSEKMALGGPLAVRAYPQGEASSDDAWLVNFELRYALNAAWQASLFYDEARGSQYHQPLASDAGNDRHLAGHGLGLSYDDGRRYRLLAAVAWRDGGQPTSDVDRNPRFWISAAMRF